MCLTIKTWPMKASRIIISGGGTGGHIYPAIAIANAIKEKQPNAEILFVGANGKMEMEKVPKAGYEIVGLDIAGLQRKLTLKNLSFPFKLIKSLKKAKQIVKDFNPDIAIGVGGYASGPLLRQAGKAGVPTLLQEQNSYPGITNKLLAKKALKICVAYDKMERFFDAKKIVFTGNPVRKEILNIKGKRDRALSHFKLDSDKKTLLVIGGSLGARTINNSIKNAAKQLEENNIQVLWQTGKYYFEDMKSFVEENKMTNIKVHDFIYEMDLAYASADLVVSRAGALSISELCLVGKPTILVPSPNVSEDHQTKNAMALVNHKAAKLVKDVDAPEVLGNEVVELINDNDKLTKLSVNIIGFGRPNAAETIANEVIKLIINK
jgi:UDP-N-acetylglucosamine--N-acetylmuramyl-(pentapeptide) pyrophosphoryl-undecaprenol N-acetylglucosamine transferase